MERGHIDGIYNRYFKRIFDLILAISLFLILWPIYLILALWILADSGLPILYSPLRGGYHNKPFHIYKFRTMVKNADQIGGGTTALHDPRITRAGKILRKMKLDELPQLLNILKGEMSFIGPRPELLQYTDQYQGEEKLILEVRPGITDYSSIKLINLDEIVGEENADEVYETKILKQKNEWRIQYAKNVSFVTDLKILIQTIGSVLKKIVRVLKGEVK